MSHRLYQFSILLACFLISGCSNENMSADSGGTPDLAIADDAGAPDLAATRDTGSDQHSLPPPLCKWVDTGVGPVGKTKLSVQTIATGLEIPWALAFPNSDDILVTEMAGRVRLIRKDKLQNKVVLSQQALLRIIFDAKNPREVTQHEVYLQGRRQGSQQLRPYPRGGAGTRRPHLRHHQQLR